MHNNMNHRDRNIDLAKGIAIIFMVIGHCYCTENDVLRTIYAFHMPFFFLISGILYAEKWRNEIRFSFFRTARKLLTPYFIFDTLFFLFVTVLGRTDNLIQTLWDNWIGRILPLEGTTVTWYLPCQLTVLCIFALGAKYLKRHMWITACVIMYFTSLLTPSHTLLSLQRSLIGVGFFAVGFYGKPLFTTRRSTPLLLGCCVLYLWLVKLNGMVSLVSLEYSNPVLYTVNSLLGSWLLCQFCLRLPCGKWAVGVEYLGKNTVIVLCTHMFFVEIIRLLDHKLFDSMLPTLGIWEGVAFGGIVVGLMFPVIALSNRYFGKMFGK